MFGKDVNEKVPADKAALRKSNASEQMALAKLFDGSFPDFPGGLPAHIDEHSVYAPFAGSDALEVLVDKMIFVDCGADGYARGYNWDGYVYNGLTVEQLMKINAGK